MKRWGVHARTASTIGSHLYNVALAVEEARAAGSATGLVLDADELKLPYLVEKLTPFLPQPGPTGRACEAALALARVTPSFTAALAHTILEPVRDQLARGKREAGRYDFDDMLSLVDDALRGPGGPALVTAHAGSLVVRPHRRVPGHRRDAVVDLPSRVLRARSGTPLDRVPGRRSEAVDLPVPWRGHGDVRAGARRGPALGQRAASRSRRASGRRRALVDATNALFDATVPKPFFAGANAYAPVACGRPDSRLVDGEGRPVTPVLALRIPSRAALPQLAARIGQEIRVMTDPACPWRLDGQPLAFQDVYVLSRTGAEGRVVGTALRAAGVPHAFFKEEGLFQTDEAREIPHAARGDRRAGRPGAAARGVADALLRPAAGHRRARARSACRLTRTWRASLRGRCWRKVGTSSGSSRASCRSRGCCGARSCSRTASAISPTRSTCSSCSSSTLARRGRPSGIWCTCCRGSSTRRACRSASRATCSAWRASVGPCRS